jgi:hypothetical protein
MITTISFAQVSTTRINDFRLGEKKSDLERLMGKSINVNFNEYGYMENPVNVVYKGVVYELFFSSSYDDNGNELNDYFLYSVRSKDKTLKTLSGIKVGSTFDELLNKFKDYNIEINDSWDDNGNRTKTERLFTINDYDTGTYLVFKLKNGKVTEFFVSNNEGGC